LAADITFMEIALLLGWVNTILAPYAEKRWKLPLKHVQGGVQVAGDHGGTRGRGGVLDRNEVFVRNLNGGTILRTQRTYDNELIPPIN